MVFQTHASLLISEGDSTKEWTGFNYSLVDPFTGGGGAFVNMGMNLELYKPRELIDNQVLIIF